MTPKLSLLAAVAAVLAGGATQSHAQGYEGGYLPPPAYAYNQYPAYDYGDGGYDGCGEAFTLAGAHAGVTVLGINLDGAAKLSIGEDGGCHHHRHVRYAAQGYAPPPPVRYAPPPAYYPPMDYAPAPQPCGCEAPPPPPPPCGCGQPSGW